MFAEGATIKEVAKATGRPKNTVSWWQHDVRRGLGLIHLDPEPESPTPPPDPEPIDVVVVEEQALPDPDVPGFFCGACGEQGHSRNSRKCPLHPSNKGKDPAAVALGRKGGIKGGAARMAALSPEERSEMGKRAAAARWGKPEPIEEPRRGPGRPRTRLFAHLPSGSPERYQAYLAEGMCPRCERRPLVSGYSGCSVCLARARRFASSKAAEPIEAGRCAQCSAPMPDGKGVWWCKNCLAERRGEEPEAAEGVEEPAQGELRYVVLPDGKIECYSAQAAIELAQALKRRAA